MGHIPACFIMIAGSSSYVQGLQAFVNPEAHNSAPDLSGIAVECMKVQPGGKYLLALLSTGAVRFWNTHTKVQTLCTSS